MFKVYFQSCDNVHSGSLLSQSVRYIFRCDEYIKSFVHYIVEQLNTSTENPDSNIFMCVKTVVGMITFN